MLEIERQAFLVAIYAEEVGAFTAKKWWSPGARVVALPGLLHLQHAGAHVGQHDGAVGPREHARQVEHEDASHRCPFRKLYSPSDMRVRLQRLRPPLPEHREIR